MLMTTLRARAKHALTLVLAAIFLTGCYVTSDAPVLGEGSEMDPALVGTWRAIDEDGKTDKDLFFHFYNKRSDDGLELVMVEKGSYNGLDITTTRLNGVSFMNARFHKREGQGSDQPLGLYIVRYEIKNGVMTFALMNAEAWMKLIEDGKIKGTIIGKSKMTRSAHLTMSSRELTDFLKTADLEALFSKSDGRMKKIAD